MPVLNLNLIYQIRWNENCFWMIRIILLVLTHFHSLPPFFALWMLGFPSKAEFQFLFQRWILPNSHLTFSNALNSHSSKQQSLIGSHISNCHAILNLSYFSKYPYFDYLYLRASKDLSVGVWWTSFLVYISTTFHLISYIIYLTIHIHSIWIAHKRIVLLVSYLLAGFGRKGPYILHIHSYTWS